MTLPYRDNWTPHEIGARLLEIADLPADKEMLKLWVDNGRMFGVFLNWDKHQRVRSKFKRKTPDPPTEEWKLLRDSVIGFLAVNCPRLADRRGELSLLPTSLSPLPTSPSSLLTEDAPSSPFEQPKTEEPDDTTAKKRSPEEMAIITAKIGRRVNGEEGRTYGDAVAAVKAWLTDNLKFEINHGQAAGKIVSKIVVKGIGRVFDAKEDLGYTPAFFVDVTEQLLGEPEDQKACWAHIETIGATGNGQRLHEACHEARKRMDAGTVNTTA
jgi:hypothetical protein